MSDISGSRLIRDRLVLAGVGGLAGLAMWFLIDVLEDLVENPRIILFLVTLTIAGFGGFLAMVGPLSLSRSAKAALMMALPSAVLITWASLRFVAMDDFLTSGDPLLAYGILITLPMPFLIAANSAHGGWRDYGALFTHAWNIAVRYTVAWIFVGLFWLVLFLSDALLQIVGLDVIETLLDIDPIPFWLAGAVFGLAIAVINELANYISPFLVLRLLRLLLPLVLVVVTIFIGFLPVRGLSGLFGGLSAAGTLMAMALGGATLVTTAIDCGQAAAIRNWWMIRAAQALSLLLPVLAGLALYAIWLRISEYGLTPERIAASLVALFAAAYAVAYALAVLMRGDWMGRIRRANIYLALALILVAGLWLTPVINPQKLSTANQIARLDAGKISAEEFDLWALGREWGKAGAAGFRRLEAADHSATYAALAPRIARVQQSDNRYDFNRVGLTKADRDTAARIRAFLAENPNPPVPEGLLANLGRSNLAKLEKACETRLDSGKPGCILIAGDFSPQTTGPELAVIYQSAADRLRAFLLERDPGDAEAGYRRAKSIRALANLGQTALEDLHAGNYSLAPVTIQALELQGERLFFLP